MLFVPSYLPLYESGELRRRAAALEAILLSCTLCPHECRNNRLRDEPGRCHSGSLPIVSSYTAHFGEEPPLVGTRGVGNIFFGNCTLRCVYCQNHVISQNHGAERRHEVSLERLADVMLELQSQGCHQIGLVSPTHFVPQIVLALENAAAKGLRLPLIYNTNAFESLPVLRLLDGIVDIYLPDLKYSDEESGYRYSRVHGYPSVAREAIKEMWRQVGTEPVLGEDGVVLRGLIIRHLVLPNDLAGSKESLEWVAGELGNDVTLSVMSQYYPAHRAAGMPLLDRKVRESEYERVLRILDRLCMQTGWIQQFESSEYYRPEFSDRKRPFEAHTPSESRIP